MPASTADSTPPDQGPTPPPASRGLRWKKILLGLFLVSLLCLLGLSLVAWSVWKQRAAYAARALHHVLPQFEPTLESLTISPLEIRVTSLALREPTASQPFATLRSASITQWQQTLSNPALGRIELDGLHFKFPAADLPALLAGLFPPSAPSVAAPTDSSNALPFVSIEGVNVTDLRVDILGDDHNPHLSFTLDHNLESLDLNPESPPSLKSATFNLRDFQLRTPDGSSLSLPALALTLSFDPQKGLLHIHHLDLPAGISLILLPALSDFIGKWSQPSSTSPASSFPAWFKGVVLDRVSIPNLALSALEGLPVTGGLPAVAMEGTATYEGSGMEWRHSGQLTRPGSHTVTFSSLGIRPLDSHPGHLLFPSLQIQARQEPASSTWVVESFDAPGLEVHWTPELESALLGSAPAAPAGSASGTTPGVHLIAGSLSGAKLHLQQTPLLPFDIDCQLDLQARDLRLEDARLTSSQPQHLTLSRIQTKIPGSRTAAPTTIESIEAVIRPDALLSTGLVDRIHIAKPQLSYHLDINAYADTKDTDAGTAAPRPPFVIPSPLDKLHFAHLAITEGSVKLFGKWGADFEAETAFNLTTDLVDAVGSSSSNHTLTIDETRLHAMDGTPLPVARLGKIQLQAKLPSVLTQRRLESLTLTGGQVEFGDALLAILDPGTAPPPAPAPPMASTSGRSTAPKWSAGKVAFSDLAITLQKIAPGLPPLTFTVQFEARNTPLEPEGLLQNFDEQKIELSSLTIPAPYGLMRPVARLDTIFIYFTLDSLLRQRITKVEIVSPTLYVGEPLFWYIDYCRKFAGGGIKSDADIPQMVLAANDTDLSIAAAAEAVTAPASPAWAVEELQVHAGKLILAPKGVPLPGFRQPFPFSFNTKLDSGQFEAVFDIPPDNYPFEKLKLEFLGMKGKVHFNMPLKDVDNNLTETFWVDQIRWKQLHLEKAHLSVTYDLNGIYGKFGGEAYEGYIEGGFDVFLNDSYTWDGWIAATDVRSTEITEQISPAYFLLDGKINGTLIAAGDAKELYQADITCTNAAEGRFSIAALNEMLADMPTVESATLTDQVTRIGLETLRDFEYDKVEAKARFHGREGAGYLNISGPGGSRNFEINVLDHRWKVDPTVPVN